MGRSYSKSLGRIPLGIAEGTKESIRILMGDEVTQRTKKALLAAIEKVKQLLDDSIEKEKERNDFLNGTAAIVQALRSGKIKCKVYNKEKFHAKSQYSPSRKTRPLYSIL